MTIDILLISIDIQIPVEQDAPLTHRSSDSSRGKGSSDSKDKNNSNSAHEFQEVHLDPQCYNDRILQGRINH